VRCRQPLILAPVEFFGADGLAFWICWNVRPTSHGTAKSCAWQSHAVRIARFFEMAIPARHSFFAITHIGLAHHFVYRIAHGDSLFADAAFSIWKLECIIRLRFDLIFVFDSSGRPFKPFAKYDAAFEDESPPNKSSDELNQKLRYFWMVGRSIT